MWRYRLRRLVRWPGAVGWLGPLWFVIEKVSTADWLREKWVALWPHVAPLMDYAAIAGVLGGGWLIYRVIQRPGVIDLVELARAVGKNAVEIGGQTITDKIIQGPATAFVGDGTILKDCVWEGISYAVINDPNAFVFGAIALRHCVIVRCTFRQIGLIGTAAQIAQIKVAIATPQPAAGQQLK